MVDSALVWISLTSLASGIGILSFALYYVRAGELHYRAFGMAVVFGGWSFELGMANGYLPGDTLFDAVVGVWAVVAVVVVVAGVLGSNRR